jgi:hypothetical protein
MTTEEINNSDNNINESSILEIEPSTNGNAIYGSYPVWSLKNGDISSKIIDF